MLESQFKMNYDFLCHIIRDIFEHKNNIVLYGNIDDSTSLREVMRSNKHSMGSFILHTDRSKKEYYDEIAYWEIGFNGPYMGYNYADLFISIDYDPKIFLDDNIYIAEQIRGILKYGGHALLINPGSWASSIGSYLDRNNKMEMEAKKYSMLSDERVFIYENI